MPTHAPSLREVTSIRRELEDLKAAQRAFADLIFERPVRDPAAFYSDVRARGFALNRAMGAVLNAGLEPDDVRPLVEEARRAYRCSDFVRRVGDWPRGYRGDFETVVAVMTMANAHPDTHPEHYIQQFILDTAMSQQHRNKLVAQSSALMWGLARSPDARVLSIAAGAAPEFATFIRHLPRDRQTIVLNDGEAEALEQALETFAGSAYAPLLVPGNVLRRIPQLERAGPYDCVVAGGLYDYLDDRAALLLTRIVLGRLLKPGGRFFFTNVAPGNPFRPWLECIADWPLIERSRDQLRNLIEMAAGDCGVTITRDQSGLVELVTVDRAPA